MELNIIHAFDVLSALLELQKLRDLDPNTAANVRKETTKLAARVIDESDISELWTIHRCATIRDREPAAVAPAFLGEFARRLTGDNRRAVAEYITEHAAYPATPLPSIHDTTPAGPRHPMSIYQEDRPGYHDDDAQPMGLIVRPDDFRTTMQLRAAATAARLSDQLRDTSRSLPPHVRTQLRDVKLSTDPDRRHERLPAIRKAALQVVDHYMATSLNRVDLTTTGLRTIFDIDDDNPRHAIALNVMQPRIAMLAEERNALEAQAKAEARNQATLDTANPDAADTHRHHLRNTEITDPHRGDGTLPPGYELDYAKAALRPITTTPCVTCWLERRPRDVIHNGHDDQQCGDCRAKGTAGVPPYPTVLPAPPTVPAYANTEAREAAKAAHADAVAAAILTALPTAVAKNRTHGETTQWLRARWRTATPTEQAILEDWRNRHLTKSTAPTPPPATPAPAMAAA